MTQEQFFEYIGEAQSFYRLKGKALTTKARQRYAAYVNAYRVKSFLEAYYLSLDSANRHAAARGLADRDGGRPMLLVQDLL